VATYIYPVFLHDSTETILKNPTHYQWQFNIRTFERDRHGRMSSIAVLNYLEETATRGSAFLGFPLEWYFEHQFLWLGRRMTIRYEQPVYYGDTLQAETWISSMARVRSDRDYRLTRDGETVVRARTNWAFIDTEKMRPTRIPQEFFDMLGDDLEEPEPVTVHLEDAEAVVDAPVFEYEHQVLAHEIDVVGHVNNSVYPRWTEQALYSILPQNMVWQVTGRDLDYRKDAVFNDMVMVRSQLVEKSATHVAVQHDILKDSDILVREYSVYTADDPQQFIEILCNVASGK
jgi:acyl-CoA thioesterase FadM